MDCNGSRQEGNSFYFISEKPCTPFTQRGDIHGILDFLSLKERGTEGISLSYEHLAKARFLYPVILNRVKDLLLKY